MKGCVLRFRASIRELTPEQAALLIAVGFVLGVFPMMGVPTVLCLLAAFVFRMNAPALQLLNNISSPLQIALLLPLERAGAWLCGSAPAPDGSLTAKLGVAALHAVAGWFCICIPFGVILYFLALAMHKYSRWCRIAVGGSATLRQNAV